MTLDLRRHPCFSRDASHRFARIHLPVAPKCNMQCHFCNRKFDCQNESRPGVTSTLLQPRQALEYLRQAKQKVEKIAVVGIAGPGDPFANAPETMETLHWSATMIRRCFCAWRPTVCRSVPTSKSWRS